MLGSGLRWVGSEGPPLALFAWGRFDIMIFEWKHRVLLSVAPRPRNEGVPGGGRGGERSAPPREEEGGMENRAACLYCVTRPLPQSHEAAPLREGEGGVLITMRGRTV